MTKKLTDRQMFVLQKLKNSYVTLEVTKLVTMVVQAAVVELRSDGEKRHLIYPPVIESLISRDFIVVAEQLDEQIAHWVLNPAKCFCDLLWAERQCQVNIDKTCQCCPKCTAKCMVSNRDK